MRINFFINNRFEKEFIGEREINIDVFKSLHPLAEKWAAIIVDNRGKLSELDGTLNLVYNMADHSITPRNFNHEDVIRLLNAEVNKL